MPPLEVGSVLDFLVLGNVSANFGTSDTFNMFSTRLEASFIRMSLLVWVFWEAGRGKGTHRKIRVCAELAGLAGWVGWLAKLAGIRGGARGQSKMQLEFLFC